MHDSGKKKKKQTIPWVMLPKLSFSFQYLPDKCLDDKIKSKYFTNKIDAKEKPQFFARIFSILKVYSGFTLKELENQGICYVLKEKKHEKILGRLAEILSSLGYKDEWINKNFHAYLVYKFKLVSSNIRMFGYYSLGIVYVLLFDPNHLIEPDDKFGVPGNLVCTWCIKSCDKK